MLLLLLFTALFRLTKTNGTAVWRLIAFSCPVLLGYGYLQLQGWRQGDNSSYDAYKLFAVFHPLLLVALCPWLTWLKGGRWLRLTCMGAMLMVTVGNIHAMRAFAERMSRGVLIVEPTLRDIQALESYDQVDSVKLMLEREPRRLPTLTLVNPPQDIFDFRRENFELSDYDPHPGIKKIPVAV